MDDFSFDWADLAFGDKKPIRDLNAKFVAAPRTMSKARFKELARTYLPAGNIIVGLSKEPWVEGLEGRPQFTMLTYDEIAPIIKLVNQKSPNKIYTLSYFQREAPILYDKVRFPRVVLVNGSWLRSLHLRPEYHVLMGQRIPYEMVSPFTDEREAKAYEKNILSQSSQELTSEPLDEAEVFSEVERASSMSFDTSFPVGAVLAEKKGPGYLVRLAAHNTVVPYETYAFHYGATRERHHSMPGDLTHYDSVHAEMMILVESARKSIPLAGSSLFVNVLPCPTCARTLSKTDIGEIVYSLDHSSGYAVALLEASGKTVRRRVGKEVML